MTINFGGNVYDDAGNAVSGASVKLLETGTTTQEGSTVTTDVNGRWDFLEADQDRYDVEITKGSSVRRIKWSDEISLQELDVRNNTGATTPAATFTNLTDNATNQVAVFSGANATKADNDEIYLSFKMHDSAGNLDEFARMTVVATDVTSTSEDGQIEFDVIKAGQLTPVWTITSSTSAAMSFDMNVDALTIGSGADTDVSLTFDANSADGVITWMEDEDYFKFSDDILMNSTERINFYDTAIYIYSSTDGQLDLVADTEIQIAATTIDINGAVAFNGALTGITNITLSGTLSDGNYTFDTSGNVSGLGTVGSGAITSSGIIKTDDATEATSTTDGSLQTDGGLSVVKDAVFGDDIKLLSDSAVIALGADGDTTLTHTDGTGLTLNSTNKLTFGDAATFIHQSSDGVMTVDGEATIDLNASTAVLVSNDLKLNSDSAVLGFGVDNDTTLTHTDGTGLTLNSTNKLTFGDTGTFIHQSSDGVLTITSDTTVDINGAVDCGGVLDMDSNAINNIAAAGNDFAAAQLDLAADFTILGADGLTVQTTTGDLTLDPAGQLVIPQNQKTSFGHNAWMNIMPTSKTQIWGTSVSQASLNIVLGSSTSSLAPTLAFGRSGVTTPGSAVIVADDMDLGEIIWYAADGNNFNPSAAKILVEVDGTPGVGDMPSRMSFWTTADGAASPTERLRIDSTGAVFINDTDNEHMNTGPGLTINMGAADKETLALKSSDVGHSFTDYTETDTFGLMRKASAGAGGLLIESYIEAGANSFYLRARTVDANTDKTTSAYAPIHLQGSILDTNTAGAVSADGNLVTIDNLTAVRFIFDAEGSGHADVEWVAYDSHDDLALMDAFQREATGRLTPMRYGDNPLYYARTYMEDIGIVGKDSWHTEQRPDGRVQARQMVNFTKLSMLHHGAILQIGDTLQTTEERLHVLEGRLLALEGGN